MATEIYHLQQPTDNTCMSTVLAMITAEPVGAIIERWHPAFENQSAWYDDVLLSYKVPYIIGSVRRANLMSGFGHILTVPSLNIPGVMHAVLAVWPRDSDVVVLDPNYGRPGKRYYTRSVNPNDPLAFELGGWQVDVYVPLVNDGTGLEIRNDRENNQFV